MLGVTRATIRSMLCIAFVPALPGISGELRAQTFGTSLLQSEMPADYDLGRNVSVLDRARPEYDPIGIPVGPIILKPILLAEAGYSSNVAGSNDLRQADSILRVEPRIVAATDDANLQAWFLASAELRRFARSADRNENAYQFASALRWSVLKDVTLLGGAELHRRYEQNISTGVPSDAAQPVPVTTVHAHLGAEREVGRIQLTVIGDFRRLSYGNVLLRSGDTSYQGFRDRDEWLGAGRITFEVSRDTSVFAEFSAKTISYDETQAWSGDNRDAMELRLLGGINLDVGALVRGRFGVGYSARTYRSPIYDKLNGLAADIRLQFFPSQITTLTLNARRFFGESTIPLSPGYTGTSAKMQLDHELRRHMLLNLSVEYENDRYRASNRLDNSLVANTGVRYLLSQAVGLGVNFSYLQRRSSGEYAVPDFDEAQASLSLIIQR